MNAYYLSPVGALCHSTTVMVTLHMVATHGHYTGSLLHMVTTQGRYTWSLHMVIPNDHSMWSFHVVIPHGHSTRLSLSLIDTPCVSSNILTKPPGYQRSQGHSNIYCYTILPPTINLFISLVFGNGWFNA